MKMKFDPITPEFAMNVTEALRRSEASRGMPSMTESSLAIGAVAIKGLNDDITRLTGEIEEQTEIQTRLAAMLAEAAELEKELARIMGAE